MGASGAGRRAERGEQSGVRGGAGQRGGAVRVAGRSERVASGVWRACGGVGVGRGAERGAGVAHSERSEAGGRAKPAGSLGAPPRRGQPPAAAEPFDVRGGAGAARPPQNCWRPRRVARRGPCRGLRGF